MSIVFASTVVLNGVTGISLDANSIKAVKAGVALVIGIKSTQVQVTSSKLTSSSRLRVLTDNNQMNVVLQITSSTADFVDTAATHNTTALFNKLKDSLMGDVSSGDLVTDLQTLSVTYDATATASVTGAAVSSISSFTEVEPTDHHTKITE
eukprot:gene42625-52869_t